MTTISIHFCLDILGQKWVYAFSFTRAVLTSVRFGAQQVVNADFPFFFLPIFPLSVIIISQTVCPVSRALVIVFEMSKNCSSIDFCGVYFFLSNAKTTKSRIEGGSYFCCRIHRSFCVGCQLGAAEGNPPNYKQSMEQRFPFGDFSLNHYPSGNPSQCALFRSNLEVFVWMFLLVGLSLKMKVLLYHVFSR